MLRFYAKHGALVSVPFQSPLVGQRPRYVGRTQDDQNRLPASDEPFAAEASSRMGMRLARICGRGDLWAADKATAKYCRVPFVGVSHVDGEWVPSKPHRKTSITNPNKD